MGYSSYQLVSRISEPSMISFTIEVSQRIHVNTKLTWKLLQNMNTQSHTMSFYCWWKEILHHLRRIKPCKYWDKLPINWCRISSINSMYPRIAFKHTTIPVIGASWCFLWSWVIRFQPPMSYLELGQPQRCWDTPGVTTCSDCGGRSGRMVVE